jgi:hypothetical protein
MQSCQVCGYCVSSYLYGVMFYGSDCHIYLFIHFLYHTVSVSDYMALDGRMIVEASLGKDLEGSSYILRFYTACCLKGLIKPQKPQDSW